MSPGRHMSQRDYFALALGAVLRRARPGVLASAARSTGIPASTLWRWEAGKTIPDAWELHTVAIAYRRTATQLLAATHAVAAHRETHREILRGLARQALAPLRSS